MNRIPKNVRIDAGAADFSYAELRYLKQLIAKRLEEAAEVPKLKERIRKLEDELAASRQSQLEI